MRVVYRDPVHDFAFVRCELAALKVRGRGGTEGPRCCARLASGFSLFREGEVLVVCALQVGTSRCECGHWGEAAPFLFHTGRPYAVRIRRPAGAAAQQAPSPAAQQDGL